MKIKKLLACALTAGMMLSFMPATAMADSEGWVEDEGGWRYYTSETEYLTDTWQEIDGHWYYFFEDGLMACDKWVAVSGKLYHFDKRGHMEKNKWVQSTSYKKGWFYVGSDGTICTGWKKINGYWYYFEQRDNVGSFDFAEMYTGIVSIDSELYYFDDSGKMRTDCWAKDYYDKWHYFGSNGKAVKGWKKLNGKWYLFQDFTQYPNGMSTGVARLDSSDGYEYWVLDDDGVLTTKTGWYLNTSRNKWNYIKSGGKCAVREWLKIDGKWYYFDGFGEMVADQTDYIIDEKAYDFASNGICKNPYSGRKLSGWIYSWETNSGSYRWYYAGEDGKLYRNKWLSYRGNQYYFFASGEMYRDRKSWIIDGKIYSFDEDGRATDLVGDKRGWVDINGRRAYIGSDGKAYTDWHQIDGKWYCFSIYDGLATSSNHYYYFFSDKGEMLTGWIESDGHWYYADPSGNLYYDKWLNYKGSWYYLNQWGRMEVGSYHTIKGCRYKFDEDGRCLNPYNPEADIR